MILEDQNKDLQLTSILIGAVLDAELTRTLATIPSQQLAALTLFSTFTSIKMLLTKPSAAYQSHLIDHLMMLSTL